MLRPDALLLRTSLTAIVLLAAGSLLHADDPSAVTPPPGYKVVYHDVGGRKVPIFVKDLVDPLHAVHDMEIDPLDHQKVFSETNPMANKTFLSPQTSAWDKPSTEGGQNNFANKVYNSTEATRVFDLGSKTAFQTDSYGGVKAATGYDQNYATKTADIAGSDPQAVAAFAAIGSSDQNRTASIDARPYDTFANPDSNKTFVGPEEDARHRKLSRLGNGQLLIDDIPDRPLSIDEVKNLINRGFKPDTSQPAPPASKALNDPNYQPEPIRIEPTTPDTPPATAPPRTIDDDANDPVPSPGTMAEPPPENAEPLPSK